MSTIIKIEDFWKIQTSLIIGLSIQSNEKFPVVVGCSLQTDNREIVDIPARLLSSPGFAFWGKENCDRRFKYPKDSQGLWETSGWNGRIIFAVYSDSSFRNRLADTDWIAWDTYNLIGSSTAGLDDRDEKIDYIINNKYSGRKQEVWTALNDQNPIDIWKPFLH